MGNLVAAVRGGRRDVSGRGAVRARPPHGRDAEARGYALDDPVAREGDDRDIVTEYVAAHEITEAVEQGKDVSREDIDLAIDGYRALHDYLLAERAAP